MRKILFTFSLITAMLFALSSCQSDWYDNGGNGGGNRPVGGEEFLLQLTVPGNSINTRMTVPSEDFEDDVQTLHVLFFNAGTGMFIDYMAFDGNPLDLSAPIRVRFRDNPLLNHSDEYRLLIVANIEPYLNPSIFGTTAEARVQTWLHSFDGASFATAMTDVLDLHHFNAANRIQSGNLLMTAIAERTLASDIITVDLERSVVRVDVELSSRVSDNFTLVSAQIWNVPNNTALWDANLNCFDRLTCIIDGSRPFPLCGAFQCTGTLTSANVRGFRGMLYTFPNRQNAISQNDRHTTAVIIGINDGTATTYHRINVSMPFAGQDLVRNTVHNVTVNHVLGRGADSPMDAYNANRSMLQVSINQSDMDSQGVIHIDGNNVLVLPTNRIVFPPEGGQRDFRIFTHSPDGSARLIVSEIISPPGMNIVLRGTDLYVSVDASVDARYGHIEFRFGNITARIYVVQECSIVEFLELNLGLRDIHRFSNEGIFPQFMTSNIANYVQVTSSGEWTARMFNEGFRFATYPGLSVVPLPTQGAYTIDGNNGDRFSVAAHSDHTDMFVRYGFVLVSLVSNPNINQVVIVTQQGTDLLRVYCENLVPKDLPMTYFYAGGNVMTSRGSGVQTFIIQHSDDFASTDLEAVWQPTPETSVPGMEGRFAFTLTPTAHPQRALLTITTQGMNPDLGNRVTGRILVSSPNGGTATFNIEQGRYNFPMITNPPTIPAAGGTTAPITVAATQSIGAGASLVTTPATTLTWTATISTNNSGIWNWYTINPNPEPVVMPTTGTTGSTFTVEFPRLPLMMIDTTPAETVTLNLNGITGGVGGGSQTITITQGQRTVRNLYIVTGNSNNWGTWNHTDGATSRQQNFRQPRIELSNTSNFGGANAVVRSGTHTFSTTRNRNQFAPQTNAHIFLANSMDFRGVSGANLATATRAWTVGDDRRVLIAVNEHPSSGRESFGVLMNPWGFTTIPGRANNTIPRGINTGNANTSAIHNYLLRDGPFTDGVDISANILFESDNYGSGLTGFPSSFIPLVHLPGQPGTIVMGIDTQLGIFYIGDTDMLGDSRGTDRARTPTDFNPATARGAANLAFVRNLSAWMVGVAQYGREYIEHINAMAALRGIAPVEVPPVTPLTPP